jgi:carbonic anhydrase/acetyltransferase-like protein (isoleucine patch superfamily)
LPIYSFNGEAPDLPEPGSYWIAPDADLIGRVRLDADVSIWFGAVLRGDIEPLAIGERSNVQDLSVMHTDGGWPLDVGRNCTIGHRALLHGCTIGDNTLIGMGAIVMTGARIGANCLIAAHALVPEHKEIPDGSLVMGVPGRIVRQMTDKDIESNSAAADRYVKRWREYDSPGFRRLGADDGL